VNTITVPEQSIPVVGQYDVIVAGGGPGGLPAAIAAARHGAKVLIVERHGYLGGLATAGLIMPILAHTAHDSHRPIVEGILKEMTERMHALGGAPSWKQACTEWGVRFDPETFKYVADLMTAEAEVDVRFHTVVTDAVVDGSTLTHLIVESKSGRQAVAGKVFVDATGDADVAFRSGAPTTMGRSFDGRVESMGSFILLGGIEGVSAEQAKAAQRLLEEEMTAGTIRFYGSGIVSGISMQPDHYALNRTRFSGDPTNVRDLTLAETTLREQAWRFVRFLRRQPGFEKVYLRATSPQAGARESRQIAGDYLLDGDDIHLGRKHHDAIARGSWWIDIHCPLGNTYPVHLCTIECPKQEACPYWAAEHELTMRKREELYPPQEDWYDIPYRCLVPKKIDNLLVSGRCISATHQGMAGARVMGTCMAIGQAAGTAAALAADAGAGPREVDVTTLRDRLRKDGALV